MKIDVKKEAEGNYWNPKKSIQGISDKEGAAIKGVEGNDWGSNKSREESEMKRETRKGQLANQGGRSGIPPQTSFTKILKSSV